MNNFDPCISKMVLYDEEYYYTLYLNGIKNSYFNDVLYLHNIGFYNDIGCKYTILMDNNGPIGFKMNKLKVISDELFDKIKNNTNIKNFYINLINKQNIYNVILADIDYKNCGLDKNNNIYLFDIDCIVDKNLFTNNKYIKELSNIELFWLVDRGYKQYNKIIDKIFNNIQERKCYYINI